MNNGTLFVTSWGTRDDFDSIQLSMNTSQALRLIKILAEALDNDVTHVRLSAFGMYCNGINLVRDGTDLADAPSK